MNLYASNVIKNLNLFSGEMSEGVDAGESAETDDRAEIEYRLLV